MEATFVQEGHLIDWPISPTAIAAGEVIVVNNVCFVARQPIPANTQGAMAATGVYDVLKTAGLVIPTGVAVFWNDTTNRATLTTSDVYMGVAIRTALSGDATVRVHLRSLQEVVAGQFGLGTSNSSASARHLFHRPPCSNVCSFLMSMMRHRYVACGMAD